MSDPLFDKAEDFTTGTSPKGGEVRVVEVCLVIALHAIGLLPLTRAQAIVRRINANPTASRAGRTLATGLFAEHFRSLLAPLPDHYELVGLPGLDRLREGFEEVVEEFLALTEPNPPELLDDHDVR